MQRDELVEAMRRLCVAERARREAIEDLLTLGAVRSRQLVGDLGEALAARFYGVDLPEATSMPGYDLVAADGRLVQVRTLRSAANGERTSMGVMRDPYDTLFAVKLSIDFEPLRAIEVARPVLERHYPHGTRTSWTKRLEAHDEVRRISANALLPNIR